MGVIRKLPDSLGLDMSGQTGQDVVYLVIFDRNSDIPFEDRGEVEEMEQDGVTVVVVRV